MNSHINDPSDWRRRLGAFAAVALVVGGVLLANHWRPDLFAQPRAQEAAVVPQTNLLFQDAETAHRKSAGCMVCHKDSHDPHFKQTLRLGCCDCHGGDPTASVKEYAHVAPRFAAAWKNSGNPVRSYTLLNHESPEFTRFVNPGDLRVAHLSCGTSGCHPNEVMQNKTSMMTHGCMLWGAALYNNGGFPLKQARYGESYSMNGVPQRLQTWPPPSEDDIKKKGVVPYLDPLPRFEMSQPGNILRIFERGGRFLPEIGIPERLEESGRPRARLSVRGLGTSNRTDPVFVGLQRTRLLDPTLNFMGTNDHPGEFRSSGCTACHMVYANDRSPVHSGPYAKYGNRGTSFSTDPMIPHNESGHPIKHEFTRAIPTSQCIVCHIHPGTNVMNSYLGYIWWDEETDGAHMYPKKQKNPTAEEFVQASMSNPDEASARGLWGDPEFLARVWELNPQLQHTQFADFHGHGWVFRAVYKKDRQGRFLDHEGKIIDHVTTQKLMAAVKMPEKIQEQLKEQCREDESSKTGAREHGGAAPHSKPASSKVDGLARERDGVPVHLMDIHLERGMHCVDCHFVQDSHGNGKLYQEVRAAIEIQCIDCHGTITKLATLKTSGPAAALATKENPNGGRDLTTLRTPFGKRRFEQRGDKLIQNSMVEKDLWWELKQVRNVIDPKHNHYNQAAALAKTVRFESKDSNKLVFGDVPGNNECNVAHANKHMSCIACHSSWNPSCFGCHLPQRANKKLPGLHNEGEVTRNYVAYNFQTLRDDVFMLAKDGDVTGNKIGPARSSCAIHVGSYNGNRDSIYVQQQTISADGLSGIAFSSNVPHTVRGGPARDKNGRYLSADMYLPGRGETKTCTDCHVSKNEDNNAIMTQLLMQGTGYVNFMGKYCWVAAKDHGLHGVIVTEQEEPQAVIGSLLHRLAFPDFFKKHHARGYKLEHAHEHPGVGIGDKLLHPRKKANILQVQPRGEYLYAACGEDGVRVFDIAFIDNKSFSERITTAPVSPLGQQFYVKTKYAAGIASPCTPAPDPTRKQNPANKEPKVHGLYGYLYVADKYEGLIMIGAGVTIDGNPVNNFLKRDVVFNPDGLLNGARNVTIVGTFAYVCCDAGLVVVNIDDPTKPHVTSVVGEPFIKGARAVQAQFRYAFVCDSEGVKILDVTNLAQPVPVSAFPLEDARSIYLARTYAYVAAGHQGLVILDITNPGKAKLDQVYNAGGHLNDVNDVKLGITYVSEFAYIADGHNGLRVVQLTSPETPGNQGFSPRPTPHLVATYPIPHGGHALSVGRALDRDRAVDESGNQIAVFGRIGAGPLSLAEQHKMYLRNGQVWRVSDDPADPEYRHVEFKRK